jgi:hypothetical protein
MKAPARLRQFARIAIGAGKSESIKPEELQQLAAREDVLVLAFGPIDDRLPGEQRSTSMSNLERDVAGVSKTRPIVTHCG